MTKQIFVIKMMYNQAYTLLEVNMDFSELYNIETDLWTYLQNTDKKIVMYGTGNGADKIINIFEKKCISLYGIFASDDFARDRVFRGHKVRKYIDFKNELDDFIVVVSFATQRSEVMENIYRIADETELYAPDVPVFGEGIFDLAYFYKNRSNLLKVYNSLADELSRKTFICTIAFKLTGKIKYLKKCETAQEESIELLKSLIVKKNYIDIGAYTGDTVQEFTKNFGNENSIYAFEPDLKNYNKMLLRLQENGIKCICHNAAAWNNNEIIKFYSNSGRAGSAEKSLTTEKYCEIKAVRVDDLIHDEIGFIKIDAEGSDLNALKGLEKTIIQSSPCIKIAAYHRNEDYFSIPQYIDSINPNYKLYMRHLKYIPGWDTDFIFDFEKN